MGYFILLLIFNNSFASENKIIFKLNDKAFTSLDYEKRIQYLEFVGNNTDLDSQTILDDFISANIFFEYYQKLNNRDFFEEKIVEIFENIKKTNKLNKKEISFKLDDEDILHNIKIDYIRKTILENILNSNLNNLNLEKEEIDLIYKFKIKYLNFKLNNKDQKIREQIFEFDKINIDIIKNLLTKNNINFFFKENEINDIKNIDQRIINIIKSNKNYLIIEKKNEINLIFIEKSFETLDGMVATLYSVRSKNEIKDNNLKCEHLNKFENNENLIKKDYNFKDLNKKLKENLININDYITLNDNNDVIYVILCNISFDKNILNEFNLNKLISLNVIDIEEKFINKYSKIYNLKLK